MWVGPIRPRPLLSALPAANSAGVACPAARLVLFPAVPEETVYFSHKARKLRALGFHALAPFTIHHSHLRGSQFKGRIFQIPRAVQDLLQHCTPVVQGLGQAQPLNLANSEECWPCHLPNPQLSPALGLREPQLRGPDVGPSM